MLPKIVRYDVLHPQKAMVLRELTKALDDPKRAVRKEAVDARYRIFNHLLNSMPLRSLSHHVRRTSWFTYSG
jgi:oligoendopeptidase F